jgi:hypothetical protein
MTWKTLAAATLAVTLFLPVQAEALETNELLALVAMPLAVAAVSEVTDVPASDLIDVVTLLNDANVPPVQFVETVRYVPLALVVEEPVRTPFVEFVRTRYQAGVVGIPLVTEIEREIRFYGIPDVELDVIAQPTYLVDRDDDFVTTFLPAPVRTQVVANRRAHPHGGPPGQLKKELGLQTGAEVVHGDRNRATRSTRTIRVDDDRDDRAVARKVKAEKPPKVKVAKAPKAARSERVAKPPKVKMDKPGRGHGSGDDHGRGHGGGKGKGKGKG